MNDKVARSMIYTLKRYITDEEFAGTATATRLDTTKLKRWSKEESDEYTAMMKAKKGGT